ncbi:aminomethyltransferase family protein [Paraburkholderia sp. CNPSo 3272]|uniref:aminomethyltransferase family protein n=1 Tax=Paraburkholderia sp. CNPSo 3272 TaxID=2940931 RepID=UPI0020B8CD87|nr:aminomethyltransferase family protein [Paraburkholderia sp. CNPSo 3272]MCP3727095.1 aminomethyltransferase family protein [Paraburkholderia sp. CNPSo 3272]
MIKHTPYYHKLVAAGAKLQDRGGFATPNFFTSIADEHKAVRERAGMFDVYYQVGVEISGKDAEALLAQALVNDVRRMRDGGVIYSSICNEKGGIIDDLTCFRFDGNRFWLSPTPSRVQAVVTAVCKLIGGRSVTVTNLGYSNAYLSVQGPSSRELLGALTDADISADALKYFNFTHGKLGDVPQAMISRTGYSGELGFELFYPVEYAEYVWGRVSDAGKQFDIRPCGMKTMRSLRIEKSYLLYGLDINEDTDPLSAGLGWTVRFDDRDFVGRGALEAVKSAGPKQHLRLIDTGAIHPIVHGEKVLHNGEQVGVVTSGDPGFHIGKTFAFAYLPSGLDSNGTQVQIQLTDGSATVTGTVVDRAPYDPERRRLTS